MVAHQRRNWVAGIAGIILTAAPVLWLTSWLQGQGEAEVFILANRAVNLAEIRIAQARAVLDDLAGKGVESCRSPDLEALRRAVFVSPPIKEIALIAPDGQTLCSDAGAAAGTREVLASAATSMNDLMLDVVRLRDQPERMLRVRRQGAAGKPSLAALIPANLLLPQLPIDGVGGYARMTLADGTVIGALGEERIGAASEAHVSARRQSERYGPVLNLALAREGVIATYDDLRRIGMVVSGVLAMVILVLAGLIPWRRRHDPIAEIERGLAAGEFVPYYQPIVDIKSGGLLGAEVLVRWRKRDGSIVLPAAFIPLVESTGRILELTRVLMRQVCREAGEAFGRHPGMYVTFNVAPRHFDDSAMLNDVGAIFEGSPIKLTQLVLEVTERHELHNLNAARRVIAALQALGCRIAIDDVGTGHSGLSYILKLGVDIIKIDKMFVEAIKTEPHSRAIVETMVDLARNLRMQIVAEGVESFEQVTYLRERGIYAAQGFLFAPPLPGSAFIKLMEAMDPHRQPVEPTESPETTVATLDQRAA